MKKLLYIVAGASLASLIGLSGVVLGGEKDDPKNDDEVLAEDYNSSRSNTSTAVKTGGGEEDKTPTPGKDYNASKSNTIGVAMPDDSDEDDDAHKKKKERDK